MKMALSEIKPDHRIVDQTEGQKIDSALFLEELAPEDGRPHWEEQDVAIEFKSNDSSNRHDPFDDTKDSAFPNAEALHRQKSRGQIINYAENIFGVQHRTHLFMLFFIGRRARVMRWDRGGVITTEAFDYYIEWKKMCRIFQRLAILALHARRHLGIDLTATRIRSGDPAWDTMEDAAKERSSDVDHRERRIRSTALTGPFIFKYERDLFRGSIERDWPRYELGVPCAAGARKFLVGRPTFRAKGMVGRGTRGYVAYESATQRFYWLKDTWRARYDGLKQEGSVVEILNGLNIPNVPTVACHGDLQDQVTITHRYWKAVQPKDDSSTTTSRPAATSAHSQPTSVASTLRTLVNPDASSLRVPPDVKTTTSSIDAGPRNKRKRQPDDETDPIEPSEDATQTKSSKSHIRKHQHYRYVMEEVCLPLSDVPSGRHLAIFMLDCLNGEPHATFIYTSTDELAAHRLALTNASMLHRDISGGNILIRPKVVKTQGVRQMRWTGLLADWEMAKLMTMVRTPRQPERTVSGHSYSSVPSQR